MKYVATPEPTDTIIIACVLMAGSTIIRHVREKPKDIGKGYAKPIVYGFMLAVALLILAVPFPSFAKGLAYLGMVGAFVVNGPAIYSLAGKAGK